MHYLFFSPGQAESRSQCLKGFLLLFTIWVSGLCFGFFYKENAVLFDTTPFKRLILGNVDAPETETRSLAPNQTGPSTQKAPSKQTEPPEIPEVHGCQFPNLDPYDPTIKSLLVKYPPLDCSKAVPNLVYLDGDTLKINASKIPRALKTKNDSFKECRYKVHAKKPGTDFENIILSTSPPFNVSIKINATDEHFFSECYNKTGQVLSRSYFAVIRPKPKVEAELKRNYKKHISLNNPRETLSILLIGIDGMSRQTFIRTMPKTRNFLLDTLDATEMYKQNKIGLNTLPNVMGQLTGKHAKQFYNGKWNPREQHFDLINDAFIWTDYHRAGYRTAMMLDSAAVTAFHYKKMGWDKEPVDYYMRPMPVAYDDDKLMSQKERICVGDIPRDTLYHDYWVQLASTFNNTPSKPYFGFSFSGRFSHNDHNKASRGDHIYFEFLKKLHDKNVLNNTVIIWFSDHGMRFGKLRATYNGMIEARAPYLFFVFPPWFRKKYPKLMEVLKINQNRLTSHFDVYETMRDLLYFKAVTGKGDINQRGISLFKEIPKERTCRHISVPTQFCICNNITRANVTQELSQKLGLGLLEKVISSTAALREKCVELKLKSVTSVLAVATDDYIKSAKKGEGQLYQVTIATEPGDALYEGTVHYATKKDKTSIIGQMTRMNLYAGQADCIEDPILKQFCFCKK